MTRPVAIDAIAEAAADALERQAPAAEQLELLPPTRFEPGSQQHDQFLERIKRDRAGRPPGARNVAQQKAIDFVRRVFGDPLIESARMLLHTPETLAAELNCTKLEAQELLEKIRADLRRYMYAPRAAEDGSGNVAPPALVIVQGSDGAKTIDGRPLAPWEQAAIEIKQSQPLSEPSPPVSHDAVSHESDK